MDATNNGSSHQLRKNNKLWDKTTTSIQIKETNSYKSCSLRVTPNPNQFPKNKFITTANNLTNICRETTEYKNRMSGTKKTYSGSLYESFVEKDVNLLEKRDSIPKKDAQLLWSKVAESDIVPCVPDIFLKIACTDCCSPDDTRLDDQFYLVCISVFLVLILKYLYISS